MPVIPLQNPPGPDGLFPIPEEDLRHLTVVRRLKPGSLFKVLLPDGQKADAQLWGEKEPWVGKILRITTSPVSPPLPCWLAVGMVRWPQMEWLTEKVTELGLNRLTPLYCQRGKYSKESPISNQKLDRLQKIARETLKQCERPFPPKIDTPQTLSEWLESLKGLEGRKIFLDEGATEPRLHPDMFLPAESQYFFLVGPEGGFSPEERVLILEHPFESVSLGPKRLKTESAALYVLSVLDATLKP